MKNLFRRRPWLFIVLAFVLLMGAWASLIVIAVQNRAETIDLNEVEMHER